MAERQGLVIEHVEGSSPAAFKVSRGSDRKSVAAVAVPSPYEFVVEGRTDSSLMTELRWYLERFLDYPFHPETVHAEHVLDALRRWGTHVYKALLDRRDAGDALAPSETLRVRSDDPRVLSWPWEALYDPQAGTFVAHQRCVERQLNKLPGPAAVGELPKDRVNILLVVARPLDTDVGYGSIARPLVELIRSKNLPAHVDLLRPPTFDQLREHLRAHPSYYHVLHFDGHGAFGNDGGHLLIQPVRTPEGCLVFENVLGEGDPQSAGNISVLLREYSVPIVVLNACQSADLNRAEDTFATVATALLRSGTRSVVAMSYSLYVSGAKAFLPAFYRHLFGSGSVAEAVRMGRQQMLAFKNRPSPRGPHEFEDWLLPVLYQQDPLDCSFAVQAKIEAHESRLPREVQEHREEYGFVGRDGPILEMERALHRKAPCILVRGLSGVGKTTLARGFLQWLDETGGLDRALWFDFRDIRTAAFVINRIGEAFYGENFGAAPNKLELLACAFRENRVVLVWDNFESAADNLMAEDRSELGHLLDEMRGTRGKVVMTSRSPEEWLGPSRRFSLRLLGLEGEERWEYCEIVLRELSMVADRNDPDLNQLMDQLRGHPLAMRVVLSKLEQMTAAKVAEALRTNIAELGLSEQEEQSQLFATLRFAEHGLPEELQPIMGLVGLHEAYVDSDSLEYMAKQVDPDWTRALIDRLMLLLEAAGLARGVGKTVYEVHPLLTTYLRTRAASEVCQRAFVEIMTVFADVLSPKPLHEQRATFLFYGANFHSALHLSQRLAMDEEFSALTQSLAAHAEKSRNFAEATRLFSQLAQHAASRDSGWEAVAYHHLGIIAREQRDLETARKCTLKSLAISDKQANPKWVAILYNQLGNIAQEQRDYETAREWYFKSLAIKENQGDALDAANTYHYLGMIAQDQRDYETARGWYLKSLALEEGQDDLVGAATTYHQLGSIAQEQSTFGAAREWYLKCIAIRERQGDLIGAASAYHPLESLPHGM